MDIDQAAIQLAREVRPSTSTYVQCGRVSQYLDLFSGAGNVADPGPQAELSFSLVDALGLHHALASALPQLVDFPQMLLTIICFPFRRSEENLHMARFELSTFTLSRLRGYPLHNRLIHALRLNEIYMGPEGDTVHAVE